MVYLQLRTLQPDPGQGGGGGGGERQPHPGQPGGAALHKDWNDNCRMFSPQMYLHTLWFQSYLNIITELTYKVLNEVCHECDKNDL